jgi:hypothetical protein
MAERIEVIVQIPEDRLADLYRAVAALCETKRKPNITPEGREKMRQVGLALAARRRGAA